MASQSLYRKWRSQTFSDLVGQESIVRTLKNALAQGNPAHAYLFTGPRGTGKTSTARLLAKTINCLHPKNGEPCNECQQCREITAGNSFNVIEIDAASNRGIDSIRELREKVMMPPSVGKYKVYILDEAHMLTTEAFNALLKTLEEPPPHAIFVMATTDVHKMLPTVLSRCQRFDFKRITTRQIVEHLNFVAREEKVKLEGGAAELIARAAAGGMRDALSLLDQATAYAGQEITVSQVQAMLGVADPRAIQKFILHIAQLNSAGGLHLIHELAEAGADLRQINSQVAEYWRALMLAKAGADIAMILDRTEDEVREVQQAMQLFNLEELTECTRIFAQNELMQKNQSTPQLGLELALLACIELHRRSTSGSVATTTPVQRPQVSVPPMRHIPVPAIPSTTIPTPVQPPTPAPVAESVLPVLPTLMQEVAPIEPGAQPEPTNERLPSTTERPTDVAPVSLTLEQEQSNEDLPDWDNVSYADEEEEDDSEPTPVAEVALAVPAVSLEKSIAGPSVTTQDVKDVWEMVKRRVKTAKDGAKIAAILNGFAVVGVEGTRELPVIALKASADFHFKALQKDNSHHAIEWALKLELGQECHVKLLSPQSSIATPVIPSPGALDTKGRMAQKSAALTPRQSAYVERPVLEPPSSMPQREPERAVVPQPEKPPTKPSAVQGQEGMPLARMNAVRENRESSSAISANGGMKPAPKETRIDVLKQKAKSDPVVQEVVRMFKAEIKEIGPK